MKKSIILCLFSIITFTSYSQTGTLKGVVMYFFNDNYGDKPDIGSQVYIIKNTSNFYNELNSCIKDDYYKTRNDYFQNLSDFSLTDKEMSKVLILIPKDLRKKRKELKSSIELNEYKLHQYETEHDSCIKQKLNSNLSDGSEIVDGNGTFYFSDLEFGIYTIYIISKQRNKQLKIMDIKIDKKYQTISHNFKPRILINKNNVDKSVDDTY